MVQGVSFLVPCHSRFILTTFPQSLSLTSDYFLMAVFAIVKTRTLDTLKLQKFIDVLCSGARKCAIMWYEFSNAQMQYFAADEKNNRLPMVHCAVGRPEAIALI